MEGRPLKLVERLEAISWVFLDTAPLIYYVEEHERYLPLVANVFERLDNGTLFAVTSPVTLAECLVVPFRANQSALRQAFIDLLTGGRSTRFTPIDQEAGQRAAELRAKYNLTLTDAFQIAVALTTHCDAFLTNDITLKRVVDLPILVLDEFIP